MDVALYGVAFVADDETGKIDRQEGIDHSILIGEDLHYRLQFLAYHRANLLRRQFKRAVPNKQYRPPVARLLRRKRSTLTRAHRVSDRSPQHLRQGRDTLRKSSLPDPEIRGPSLCNHDIVRLQPLPNSWPKPIMTYPLSLRHLPILLRDLIRRYRPGLDI